MILIATTECGLQETVFYETTLSLQIQSQALKFLPLKEKVISIHQISKLNLTHFRSVVLNTKRQRVTTVTKDLIKEIKSENLFINENFIMTCEKNTFQIEKLIRDKNICGLVNTNFYQTKSFHQMNLTSEARLVQYTPNAGGSSEISEALSFEILKKFFNAKLLKTEMEIFYFPMGGSITDYVVKVFDTTIAVSVTRAMKHNDEEFTYENADALLRKKLKGIVQSSKNSLLKWDKQVLHCWTNKENIVKLVNDVWSNLGDHLKTNTVLLITLAHNSPEVFFNQQKKTKNKMTLCQG